MKKNFYKLLLLSQITVLALSGYVTHSSQKPDWNMNEKLDLIPCPKKIVSKGGYVLLSSKSKSVRILVPEKHSEIITSATTELVNLIERKTDRKPAVLTNANNNSASGNASVIAMRLPEKNSYSELGNQGYQLNISDNGTMISANTELGVRYAVSTLKQLISADQSGNLFLPKLMITDWPDFKNRAVPRPDRSIQQAEKTWRNQL